MLTATEAFELSIKKQEEIQTIDHLLIVEKRIKETIEMGHFCINSDPMPPVVAEKLAIELEEFGYSTSVLFANRFTEDGKPLAYINVGWRYKPAPNSRVNSNLVCN